MYPSPPWVILTADICPAALTVTEHLAFVPLPFVDPVCLSLPANVETYPFSSFLTVCPSCSDT